MSIFTNALPVLGSPPLASLPGLSQRVPSSGGTSAGILTNTRWNPADAGTGLVFSNDNRTIAMGVGVRPGCRGTFFWPGTVPTYIECIFTNTGVAGDVQLGLANASVSTADGTGGVKAAGVTSTFGGNVVLATAESLNSTNPVNDDGIFIQAGTTMQIVYAGSFAWISRAPYLSGLTSDQIKNGIGASISGIVGPMALWTRLDGVGMTTAQLTIPVYTAFSAPTGCLIG